MPMVSERVEGAAWQQAFNLPFHLLPEELRSPSAVVSGSGVGGLAGVLEGCVELVEAEFGGLGQESVVVGRVLHRNKSQHRNSILLRHLARLRTAVKRVERSGLREAVAGAHAGCVRGRVSGEQVELVLGRSVAAALLCQRAARAAQHLFSACESALERLLFMPLAATCLAIAARLRALALRHRHAAKDCFLRLHPLRHRAPSSPDPGLLHVHGLGALLGQAEGQGPAGFEELVGALSREADGREEEAEGETRREERAAAREPPEPSETTGGKHSTSAPTAGAGRAEEAAAPGDEDEDEDEGVPLEGRGGGAAKRKREEAPTKGQREEAPARQREEAPAKGQRKKKRKKAVGGTVGSFAEGGVHGGGLPRVRPGVTSKSTEGPRVSPGGVQRAEAPGSKRVETAMKHASSSAKAREHFPRKEEGAAGRVAGATTNTVEATTKGGGAKTKGVGAKTKGVVGGLKGKAEQATQSAKTKAVGGAGGKAKAGQGQGEGRHGIFMDLLPAAGWD